ncbi:3-keto-disaccharide hydrolase [Flavihumibacter fluvii]|uniref:3-keto-disaccharide hydrolase n=1 Tax=Flavihumibacter fluvii TaxID=2838157 RepID=UPI001BDE2A2A|nr:DUF1080 domain-containing protein [Flavihumibacter fluvii]ULQ50706.1 DUF1080 domain-containing protein [Flavihumibacter fluvii]
MKYPSLLFFLLLALTVSAQEPLFRSDLSNANFPKGIWTSENGILTASADHVLWTKTSFENFILDLDFKTASGTNSGVIVYCTDTAKWVANSVEIQIADDFSDKWSASPATWQCGAIFGRKAAIRQKVVHQPGEWNHFTITCYGTLITVILNGVLVTTMDMSKWTSAKKNPDGSDIPDWLNKPLNILPTSGYIGLQGKHAGAPIWFRNVMVRPF